MPKKINSQGDFLFYPGITIISLLNRTSDPSMTSAWQVLYDFLLSHEVLKQSYRILPLESYHMTTNSLYNKGSMTLDEWNSFVQKNVPFFKSANTLLSNGAFTPRVKIASHKLNTHNGIQLFLELPKEDYQNILGVSKALGMQRGIPNPLHITLAYQKASISHSSRKILERQIQIKIHELFSNKTLQLQAPTLCTFKKMGEFKPWDGRYSPSLFSNDIANDSASTQPSHSEVAAPFQLLTPTKDISSISGKKNARKLDSEAVEEDKPSPYLELGSSTPMFFPKTSINSNNGLEDHDRTNIIPKAKKQRGHKGSAPVVSTAKKALPF